jgi:hypothetical protein
MSKKLFSYTFIHPAYGERVTVDSGKRTRAEAHDDIRAYLLEHYGRGVAFIGINSIKEETANA